MNTTPATPPPPPADSLTRVTPDVLPRFPFLLLFIVWFAIALMATLVTFILPEYFASTTRIKIGSDEPGVRAFPDQPTGTNAWDPYFLQTEFETIQSEVVLARVIDELHLNEVWGKKYLDGGKLKTSESLMLLRSRLDIRPVRNTSLLDIRAFSENPGEARDLANEITQAYRERRANQFNERVIASLRSMEQRAQEMEERITRAKQRLEELAGAPGGTQKPAYLYAQRELDDLIDMRRELTRRINLEDINLRLPRTEQVIVLERAVAAVTPYRPNKPLNIVVGIIVGALAGFLLAMLVYLVRRWAYQRRSGNSGTNNLRGLRAFVQVLAALVVGALVGYNCAMPLTWVSLFLMLLLVIFAGLAMGYVAIAKTTPLPPNADRSLGSV